MPYGICLEYRDKNNLLRIDKIKRPDIINIDIIMKKFLSKEFHELFVNQLCYVYIADTKILVVKYQHTRTSNF